MIDGQDLCDSVLQPVNDAIVAEQQLADGWIVAFGDDPSDLREPFKSVYGGYDL